MNEKQQMERLREYARRRAQDLQQALNNLQQQANQIVEELKEMQEVLHPPLQAVGSEDTQQLQTTPREELESPRGGFPPKKGGPPKTDEALQRARERGLDT